MVNVKPPKIAPEKSENDVCSQNEWSLIAEEYWNLEKRKTMESFIRVYPVI